MRVDRWQALGLYDSRDPNAADRLSLLEFLADRGATDEQMVEAAATFGLAGLIAELVRGWPARTITIADAAERTSLDRMQIRRIWIAQGFALPADDDTAAFRDSEVRLLEIASAGIALFGEEPIIGFLRAISGGLTMIAEAAQDVFNAGVADRYARVSELEYARRSEAGVGAESLVVEALGLAYPIHGEQITNRFRLTRHTVAEGATAMRRSVGFVDLVGSTALATSRTLEEYDRALASFEHAAFALASRYGVRIVKLIGDEAMYASHDPDDAVRFATDLERAAAEIDGVAGARAAVATGLVLGRGGDLFGPTVNLVARAIARAPTGRIVIDNATATCLVDFATTPVGSQKLRGFNEPVELFLVREETSERATEPVADGS